MRFVEGVVGEIVGANAIVDVTIREGGCGRCHEVGGCGGQNLSRALCDKSKKLTVPNTVNACLGERVQVGIEDAAVGEMATRVYVIPLVGILVGAGLGQGLLQNEAVGSVIGAGLGFWLAQTVARKWRTGAIPRVVMVRREDAASEVRQ